VLAVAAVTGLADVDAVALPVPPLAPATLPIPLAMAAVALAVGFNTLAKAACAISLGGRAHGIAVLLPSSAALATGAAVFLVLR
jgi:uncharacterized membrane protein (DUF4010 family)